MRLDEGEPSDLVPGVSNHVPPATTEFQKLPRRARVTCCVGGESGLTGTHWGNGVVLLDRDRNLIVEKSVAVYELNFVFVSRFRRFLLFHFPIFTFSWNSWPSLFFQFTSLRTCLNGYQLPDAALLDSILRAFFPARSYVRLFPFGAPHGRRISHTPFLSERMKPIKSEVLFFIENHCLVS